jgi:hypothetical protein
LCRGRRVAEDEIITAILRRGSGTDLEDVGTDGLGLGQKAGLFDIPVKDTGDLPAAVNKGAELRPAAERLQTHGAGAAEQVGYNHIFEHTLGVEDAEQRFFDPVGDRTGVIALGWQELHSFFSSGYNSHFLFSHELTLIFTNFFNRGFRRFSRIILIIIFPCKSVVSFYTVSSPKSFSIWRSSSMAIFLMSF